MPGGKSGWKGSRWSLVGVEDGATVCMALARREQQREGGLFKGREGKDCCSGGNIEEEGVGLRDYILQKDRWDKVYRRDLS